MFQTARTASATAFLAAFARWRSVVHRGHLLAWALRGASLGALTAAAGATAAWAGGHAGAMLLAGAAVPLGALAGVGVARRRRWDDAAVALYLDARADSAEVITTALQAELLPDEVKDHLRREGLRALRTLDGRALVRLPSRWPLAAAGLCVGALAMSLAPRTIPAAPRAAIDSSADRVQIDAPVGWSEVERLSRLSPPDGARAARLEALSAEARRLRERLATGVDRREAMTAAERLRAAVAAERARAWEGAAERGVERAAGVLARAGFEGAAQALAARDLEALDRAMERLANAREAADRQRASEALTAAAGAAQGAGANEVAEALREEEQLLRRRADRNRLLRALAEQLSRSEDVRRAAEHLERLPSDGSARDLAEAMERALASLTPEERARLAERMRQAATRAAQASRAGTMDGRPAPPGAGAESMSAEDLAQRLREFARSEEEGEGEGEGQEAGGAQAGGAAGVPMPMLGGGRSMQRGLDGASAGMDRAMAQLGGQGGRDGQGAGQSDGRGGVGRGGVGGEHRGSTAGLDTAEGLRARARGSVRGSGMAGATVQRVAGSAGGVARTLRTGALEGAAAEELRGVDRSDIPAEYRTQVRTYFQP